MSFRHQAVRTCIKLVSVDTRQFTTTNNGFSLLQHTCQHRAHKRYAADTIIQCSFKWQMTLIYATLIFIGSVYYVLTHPFFCSIGMTYIEATETLARFFLHRRFNGKTLNVAQRTFSVPFSMSIDSVYSIFVRVLRTNWSVKFNYVCGNLLNSMIATFIVCEC